MGRKLLLPFVLLWSIFSFAGQDFRIVAIRATGSHEFTEQEIADASGLKINQTIGPAEFKNAADRLASTGAFAQVGYKYGPMGTGMFVEFQVEDAPEFLPVRFENLVWFSDGELNEELSKRVPLYHGRVPPGGELVDSTVSAIQSLLAEKRIPATAAMRMHSPSPGKPVDAVSFYVEGPALLVKKVDVTGAKLVPVSEVNEALKSIIGMNYDRGVVEESIRYRLDPLYQSHGLLHFKIEPQQVSITGDSKDPDVLLSLKVNEGPQYKFGKCHWTGNTVVAEKDLNKIMEKCSTGAIANLPLLIQAAKFANGLYFNRGYLQSKVQLVPTYDDDKKIVDYELHIVEGQQYHMGHIQVVGLEAEQCRKLESAWKIKPGEPYDPSYENQFIREHMASLRGRPARTTITQNKDATVDVRVEF
jgi:outer membrane protein insertion porin family